jgi:DNA end-binding protein Ku
MAMSKASITFGLVYIPVKLEIAVRSNNISFNQLHRKTKERIRYKKFCPSYNEEVSPQDIVKGYEYEPDKYVIFENEDFEKIKSPKDKSITIEAFVDIKEIDPIYFAKSYYVHPNGAEKPFELLRAAMQEQNKAAIARTVMSHKQNLVSLRIKDNVMIMNIMYFHEEITAPPAYNSSIKINKNELELAKQLIASMSSKFIPQDYIDEYRAKLQAAIEMKIRGKEIIAAQEGVPNLAVDLVAALKQSIKDKGATATKH